MGTELGALQMPSKCPTTKLHPTPVCQFCLDVSCSGLGWVSWEPKVMLCSLKKKGLEAKDLGI